MLNNNEQEIKENNNNNKYEYIDNYTFIQLNAKIIEKYREVFEGLAKCKDYKNSKKSNIYNKSTFQ